LCVVAASVVSGCGNGGTAGASAGEWRANARGALTQLLQDVSLTVTGSDSLADARQALTSDSDAFVLVFAYADLGGCRSIIRNTGAPQPLERALEKPCGDLELAASTFTKATTHHDPRALLRAARLAHDAQPGLVEALLLARRGQVGSP
jgi:hypothetical protein